jgi:hypothetical protein
MRPGGGKSKGSSFERQICVALSLWMSSGQSEDYYWRSASSGGRSTVAARRGKRLAAQAGDISCIHQSGSALTDQFYLECKTYRDLNFVGLLKRKGKLAEFWLETRKQAAFYKKQPMLIAKQNQQPIIVCLSQEGQGTFGLKAHLLVPSMGLRVMLFDKFLAEAKRPK